MKNKMEDTIFAVISCCFLGFVIMLIFSGERNARRSHKKKECDHNWVYDGENGSNTGAFYYCTKCGKNKYIPYRELMAMAKEEYQFWTNRPKSEGEKFKEKQKCQKQQQ